MHAYTTRPLLTVYQEDPLNAGTPLEYLRRAFLTSNGLFFIRNHGPVPQVDQAAYRLTIQGLVRRPLELSLADLRTRFPQRTQIATLVCAGSRRDELAAIHPLPGALPWGADSVGTARWRGVRLAEVLQAAGLERAARYVAFQGLDETLIAGERIPFGSSIRLEKALAPEVLLAYEMNDAPLAPEHGFPLRVLIPGYIGARSIKWLRDIILQHEPSSNYFQARDYKLFPPEITAETAVWSQGQALEEFVLNSVICTPRNDQTCQAGPTLVQGYALTGQGTAISGVELSSNGGTTWTPATITSRADRWAWCFWETTLDLPRGPCQLTVRAWDGAGRTQPEHARNLWNFKGYANNAWHRVHLNLV